MSEALFKCTEYINAHEGWTVVGWYRLGRVTDKMMVGVGEDEETTAVGTDVTCHIVSIYPSMNNFEGSDDEKELDKLKYDASQLYHEAPASNSASDDT